MMRTVFAAASAAVLLVLAAPSIAADPPAETIPLPLARTVVSETIALVEGKGVYPRIQGEYEYAKARLLLTLFNAPEQVDRNEIYSRIGELLATLDADGHSFLNPAMPPRKQGQEQPPAATAREELRPPSFRLVTTSRGTVLRWTPPATVESSPEALRAYVKRFHDEADARPDISAACALVIDLSEQTGGNAWPPFIAMYPLFGEANKASWVDRKGKRIPFVHRTELEALAGPGAAGRANPLARYTDRPLAVVVGSRTASAGEMLLVALLGESKVETFGQTSAGLSTGNKTYPLADGSSLVLTEVRYALGDGPLYRGGIPAMHPLESGAPLDTAVKAAAEWSAAHSTACAAVPIAAGQASPQF